MTSNQYSNGEAEPVAVVAIGSIFPGRGDTTGFWRDIVEGVDTFTDVPRTHWLTEDYYDSDRSAPDRTYGSRGAFIPPTSFDPLSFGIPPNSLSTTDTAQLLALVAARNVLDDIERQTACPLDKSRASVILGVAATTELVGQMMGRLQRPAWVKGMREAGLNESQVQDIADRISTNFVEWRETTFPGLLGNVVAGRIANRLDFGGSNYVTDAACASSLSAMQIALHELHAGDSDLVLTGGVDALNDIFMYMCFSKTPALSPTGDCRPLSADADGTLLGEGVGMLALRRLSDAERDGNTIHAIIKGLGGGSDGRSTAVYAPLASGQERTLTRAYQKAGYSPDTVELVEAHGTGTVAGDKTELEALHKVFDPDGAAAAPWCALGSVKSQIGHTKAAAGAAGLLKVIGGLSRKILPPTIKVRQPAKALSGDTPFYLGTKARPWIRGSAHPRRASVSSFGFGGSNFHVTLEEYKGKHAVQPARLLPAELFLVSAPDKASLLTRVKKLTNDVVNEDDLARIATETWTHFDAGHAHRAAIVAESPQHLETLCAKLVALTGQNRDGAVPSDRHIHYRSGEVATGKLALLFAGQGSQYLGMGADIAMGFPQARAVWDAACDLPATAGLKLHDLAFPPTLFSEAALEAANLRLTNMQHAQPAIAAVALSQLALLDKAGICADMQAGHSFGEVMALHNAGVFDAATALTIACERADAMSEAAATSSGGMLVVQAPASTVRQALAEAGDNGITVANDNAPEQVVISGNASQLKHAAAQLNALGINTHQLAVAAAFHSPQVAPAVKPFAKVVSRHTMAQGVTPVYANSTARPYPVDKANLIELLSEQIGEPVLFRQTLEAMHADGVTTFLEVGPGTVLTNLVRQTLPKDEVSAIALDEKHANGVTTLLCAIGQLAITGVDVDMNSLYEGMPAPVSCAQPGKHSVDLLGSNYQKPYPPQDGQAVGSHKMDSVTPSVSTKEGSGSVPESTAVNTANEQGTYINPGSKSKAQTVQEISAVRKTSHQSSAAATSTMAMQNQPPATPETAPCGQPQSDSNSTYTNGALNGSSAQQASLSAAISPALFNDVSARHADYMAAITTAHQSYLRLAAGLVGEIVEAPLSQSNQQTMMSSQVNSMHTGVATTHQPASVTASSLNGHGHLNGGSSAHHPEPDRAASTSALADNVTGASNGAYTNGSGKALPEARFNEPAPATIAPTSVAVASVASPPANDSASNGAAQARVSNDLVRELIAEKTGYPVEMIEDDMDLSGELGIDSIKQVEVLSALRTQVPEIKDVGTADMTQLRTIRQIADFFG
ncbi:MAG: beta-ketoacyl synthase N-terminal-like domain-containing protein [Granulosicoccus sp.]